MLRLYVERSCQHSALSIQHSTLSFQRFAFDSIMQENESNRDTWHGALC
jgi:hypothetical protein